MASDLFVNSSIIISFICVMDFLLRLLPANRMDPRNIRWLHGVWTGLLGILLMQFAIQIDGPTIIDLRSLAILLAAVTGGFRALAVSSVLMAAGRFFMNDITESTIAGMASIFVTAISCGLINRYTRGKWRKWTVMTLASLAVSTTMFVILFGPTAILTELVPYFWGFTILTGYLSHSLVLYLKKTGDLFRQLEEYSRTDYLTGLNNVRQFNYKLHEHVERAHLYGERLSLIMLDIDFFKKVNDTYGHKAGDEILSMISYIFENCCRSYDTVSRNGGEEFTVLLPDCPYETALQIGERIRKKVEFHRFPLTDGRFVSITVSAGVATFPDCVQDPEDLLQMADEALYRAKQSGRNRVVGHC